MTDTSFGSRLKSARKSKGLTQKELAAQIGAKHNSVSNWENDQNRPDPDTIARICGVLEIGAEFLLPTPHKARSSGNNPEPPALPLRLDAIPVPSLSMIPIIGMVRAGAGGLALEEPEGYEPAHVSSPKEYFFLRVVGDSMTPDISEGDLALVHRQDTIESGELAVIVIDGEEGTIKKVIKRPGSIVLQAFNPAHPPRVFVGEEMNALRIAGKVVRTVRIW